VVKTINETFSYNRFPKFWNIILFSLISLAFILSDWTVFYSSFGDFILALTGLVLLVIGQIKISKKQIGYISVLLTMLALNYILNINFNDYWFDTTRAILSYTKIILYSVTLVAFYNFLRRNKLIQSFLKTSNYFALVTIVIGLILTIMIYFDMSNFYNTIWRFTRIDESSYYFEGNANIVRTRSLFSEPAHLGYYLNTIFFANVFSNKKMNIWVLSSLALGLLLTLSYSMILIFMATGITYIATQLIKGNLNWSRWYWLPILPVILFVVYFWDFINETIIQRTVNIISGTDGSAYNRVVESWIYVVPERILYGNGIAHSPPMTNIYAYLLTDFGLVGFIPYIGTTVYILLKSLSLFVLFFLMNSAKGGYLNPSFWMFLFFFIGFCLYSKGNK